MKKRLFILFLIVSLLLPLVPAPARAAEDTLESEIRQQLTVYISTLGKPDATGAKNKLINHALYGKGKDLHMGESDVFTVAMLNSNLLQKDLAETLAKAILYAQSQKAEILYLGGSANWYDDNMSYSNAVYSEPLVKPDNSANRVATLNSRSAKSGLTLTPNACDTSMVDVVGGSSVRITIQRIDSTLDTVTFRVDLKVADDFDFDSGDNLSNQIGNILTGVLIETYSWDISAAFSFTVTNPCTHQSKNYRWEFDGVNVVSDVSMGTQKNPLTMICPKKDDGTPGDPYYETETTVHLDHTMPWTMDLRVCGSGLIQLMPTNSYTNEVPYFIKRADLMHTGCALYAYKDNEEGGQTATIRQWDMYGVNYKKHGYDCEEWHAFRIENRLLENGSNMLYLLIDGNEIGPMVEYYIAKVGEQNTTGNWVIGKDFDINYIGSSIVQLDPKALDIDYIQIWENGADNAPYSYFEITTAAPTCTEPGKNIHTCSLCGASYSEATGEPAMGHTLEVTPGTAATCETDGLTEGAKCTTCGETVTAQEVIPALGHAWDEGTVTIPAACETGGEIRFTCNRDPSHTRVDTITPPGHVPGDPASCTAAQTCNSCGIELFPALGHTWNEGEVLSKPSPEGDGLTRYTCLTCGETKEEIQKYDGPVRIAGRDRFETALLTADQMKKNLGIEKFDAVIVASGLDFADALAGSYLASTKNAPILLAYTKDSVNDGIRHYIRENLKEGGTVYILGGENAVPTSFEEELETFQVKRLAGAHRFETNLMILAEAGISDKPLLISTGLTFADSLSASAAKLPILLVYGDKLLPEQADFLTETGERPLYILGGEGAVSAKMEENLKNYGETERIAGQNRFETSVKIAEKFFDSPESAVLAYAWDFPDGLCGGPLAVTMNAPLILTMANYEESASNYVQFTGISRTTILGGEKLIPDTSVDLIMKQ